MSKRKENDMQVFNRFRSWCEKTRTEPSPVALQEWDKKYNHSLILTSVSRDRLIELGIQKLYHDFFYRCAMIRPTFAGQRINISVLRLSDGKMVDLASAGASEVQGAIEKEKLRFNTSARRLKFLGLPIKDIHAFVDEALNAKEVEETVGV